MSPDDLVRDYLTRLEAAAAVLPPDRRAELLEGITEHLADARAEEAQDEASTRNVLDRLGAPEEIVAAAQDDVVAAAPVLRPRGTGHELAAVLMLTAGSLLPLVGWLVGVVLLWTSALWRRREKVLGTLVVPLGPGGALTLGAYLPLLGGAQTCTSSTSTEVVLRAVPGGPPQAPPPPVTPEVTSESFSCTTTGLPGWAGAAVLVVLLVAPVVVAVLLHRTARRRAAQQPAVVVPPTSPWGGLEVAAVLGLGLGGLVLPVLGAVVGLVLACSSPRWPRGDKLVAGVLLLVPGALGFPGLPGPAPAPLIGTLGVFLGLLLGGLAAAGYLAAVLPRRAAPRPA